MADQIDKARHIITDRVLGLKAKADSLDPTHPLVIDIKGEYEFLQHSGGGVARHSSMGACTIYLDPQRADECIAAHEIMHAVLHRAGCPHTVCAMGLMDDLAGKIATHISSLVEHYLLFPILEDHGFTLALAGYKREIVQQMCALEDAPSHISYNLIWNGFAMAEALDYGESYRKAVLDWLRSRQPLEGSLAKELHRLVDPARTRTQLGIRRAELSILYYLDRWFVEQGVGQAHLAKRMYTTPILTTWQLSRPAAELTELACYPHPLRDPPASVCELKLREDGSACTLFIIQHPFGSSSQKAKLARLRRLWETRTLASFFPGPMGLQVTRDRSWWQRVI